MFNALKTGKGLSSAGISIVFANAVYISARHIYDVARYYGQSREMAISLPAILDIFAFFCAIRLRSATSKIQRILNRLGMWSMLTLSLWFNIEYALIHNVMLVGTELAKAVLISAIPALVTTLAAEILTHVRKGSSSGTTKPKPPTAPKAPSAAAKPSTTGRVTAPRQRKPKPSETISESATV